MSLANFEHQADIAGLDNYTVENFIPWNYPDMPRCAVGKFYQMLEKKNTLVSI
jgi:hypothetical protein